MNKFFTLILLVFIIISEANSRSFRVNQIPNGTVNSCSNCHNNSNGGGSLNPFGTEVKNNFLSNNNVVWNSTLASIDSDGDGFTNGQELQDPEGSWKTGTANPGTPSMVANPGNLNSIPSGTSVEIFALKSGFNLVSVSPNPVTTNSNISFVLNNQGRVKIELFNSSSMFLNLISNHDFAEGTNSIPLKVNNLSAGAYFIKISFNNFSHFEKIIVVK